MSMSIFGGPREQESIDRGLLSKDRKLIIDSQHSVRRNVAAKNDVSMPDADGSLSSQSGQSISEDEGFDDARPNRFRGTSQQYRNLIASERGLLQSLELIRARDLSTHLYNAHALKVIASKQDTDKLGQLEASSSGRSIKQNLLKSWKPAESWTAWPMPPNEIPRPEERLPDHISSSSEDPTSKQRLSSAEELREWIAATCLRVAKDLWVEQGGSVNGAIGIDSDDKGADAEAELAGGGNSHEMVVMADDEEANVQLEPVVQKALEKVDRLLTGLHRSRMSQHRSLAAALGEDAPRRRRRKGTAKKRKKANPHKDDEDVNMPSVPRPTGRPRKYPERLEGESFYRMHKRLALEHSQHSNVPYSLPSRPARQELEIPGPRGKYRSKYSGQRLPGESLYQMHKRLHSGNISDHTSEHEEDEGHDSHDDGDNDNDSDSDNNINNASGNSEHESATKPRLLRRLPTRDWTHVLQMASTVGWDEAVIQRTRKRCEELFGTPSLAQGQRLARRAGKQSQPTAEVGEEEPNEAGGRDTALVSDESST